MIEGLHIQTTSQELKEHLEERANYHRDKAEWYSDQVDSLAKGIERTRMTNDPMWSLEESLRSHQNRASYFAFMAEHIISNEEYRLSQEDLGQIELSSRYFPGAHF